MSEAPNTPLDPRRGRVPYPLRFVAGVFLVVVGVPMLVCPGPGLLSIGAGLALIGFRRPRERRSER